ncbi:uncharacterized protein LOC143466046 [Clavelina lepadiformis]|uniref:uncharacterized protein LOC143466046 n=1 Tax=Clavelina lepadiformis TaxID=159417 RepID=UPI00404154D6
MVNSNVESWNGHLIQSQNEGWSNYDDSNSESDGPSDDENDFVTTLKHWVIESQTPLSHTNSLLTLLRPHFPYLPKDSRTLLHTCRTYDVNEIAGGHYHHFGIAKGIKSRLRRHQNLCLCDQINIDGLPLFKSSTESFWPILGLTTQEKNAEPFVIGLWVGTSKPKDANAFLEKFVKEMHEIDDVGVIYDDGKVYEIKLSNVICDTPARAFVKKTKGHTGYYGCDYCEQRGVWYNHRMTFPSCDAAPRTDVKFKEMAYEDHQHGESCLTLLNIGMVSQFPLDYMHLVCLGVMRKLLCLWTSGPLKTRLGGNILSSISDSLKMLKQFLPREFLRKVRSLSELDRWKATEFRTILLYSGPVVFRDKLPSSLYDNFMLLHVSITILCSPTLCFNFCNYAGELLLVFIEHMSNLYGSDQIIYNVHALTHLAKHAEQFGPLHSFCSFPFENYLQSLKRLLRKPHAPLPQAIRRLSEKMHRPFTKANKTKGTHYKKRHCTGPLPADIDVNDCMQYHELYVSDYVLRTKSPDNCVQVQESIYLIQNILFYNNSTQLVCQTFYVKDNFFSYPVHSSRLNIWSVRDLNNRLCVINLKEVCSKCVLLPNKSQFVSIPLL